MKKSAMIIESEITNTLLRTGLPANVQGFHFIKEAMKAVIKDPNLLHKLTKRLYPEIGQKYGVSAAIVERSMRHAIETASKNGGLENINEILNAQYFNTNEKPCNGCYIALVSEIIKKNLYKLLASIDDKQSEEKAQLVRELQETIGEYTKINVG